VRQIDILIISPGLLEVGTDRGGGCEVTDYNIALQLSKYYNISILCPYYGKYKNVRTINNKLQIRNVLFPALKNYPPKSNIDMFINFIKCWICSLFNALKLVLLSVSHKIKMIVVHNPSSALFACIAAKIFRIKVIFAEGNTTPWTNPYVDSSHNRKSAIQRMWYFINLNLCKWMCKMSNAIRAQSESIKLGMVEQGINPLKIHIIPAGIDGTEFKPLKVVKTSNNFNVGFIGRLMEEKGVSLLIRVVEKAETDLPNVRFFIFGDGLYKNQLINKSNVEHIGKVPRNQLNKWLSRVQVVLFFQKELGRAEIEAMAAGKAIIACNAGEMPQQIEHLYNGILCPPEENEYINAIKYLANDSVMLEKLAINARRNAIKNYEWDNVGYKWYSLCEKYI
jgi:glycosyltransferase involved in cell wall biosynthesis